MASLVSASGNRHLSAPWDSHSERFYFGCYSFPKVLGDIFLIVKGSHAPCGNCGKYRNTFKKKNRKQNQKKSCL